MLVFFVFVDVVLLLLFCLCFWFVCMFRGGRGIACYTGLNLCKLGKLACFFVFLIFFFQNYHFQTFWDADKAQHIVGPKLGLSWQQI